MNRYLLIACLGGVLFGCAENPVSSSEADSGAGYGSAREEFDAHHERWAAWLAEPHRASRSAYYTSHPDFRAIVAMGDRAVPHIIERMKAQKNPFWALALDEITGLDPWADVVDKMDKTWGPGRPLWGGKDPFDQAWLDWWDANKMDPRWYADSPERH